MSPSPAARLRAWAVGQGGWRRRGLLVGLGLLATAALPPWHLIFLLIPALTGLLWLTLAAPTARRAFAVGWWFGVGHCGAAYYWISNSMTIDPDRYAWLIPFSIVGFAVSMAVYIGLTAWSTHRLVRAPERDGDGAAGADGTDGWPAVAGAALVFAGSWTFWEWVRGWAFTGFPWNLVGSVWTVSPALGQSAAWIGVFGLSLVTVLAACLPAVLAAADGRTTGGRAAAVAGLVVLGGLLAAGGARLAGASDAVVPGVHLRLIQPNIRQADKWKPALRQGHVLRQIEMSLRPVPGAPRPTAVIWPETSVPYFVGRTPDLVRALAQAVPPGGVLITGAPRVTPPGAPRREVWNSLHAIDASGRIAATYDKHHLVPFGEFVPLEQWFGFLNVVGQGNFSAGPGAQTLMLPGLPPMTPLICYEVIFPGRVVAPDGPAGRPRPRWMLNITNDAWFGDSAGPRQHLAAARLRAIEEGLPLVRVANTGISVIVDGYGREVRRLGLGRAGVIDGPLPEAVAGLTPFARLGNAIPLALAALAVLGGLVLAGRRPTTVCPTTV